VALGLRERGEIVQREGELQGRGDQLAGLPVEEGEGSAEGFVAVDDLIEAGGDGVDLEGPVEFEGGGNVVGGAARLELVQEPEPLLRERQGRKAIPAARLQWLQHTVSMRAGELALKESAFFRIKSSYPVRKVTHSTSAPHRPGQV
jgi:hypothetical protein